MSTSNSSISSSKPEKEHNNPEPNTPTPQAPTWQVRGLNSLVLTCALVLLGLGCCEVLARIVEPKTISWSLWDMSFGDRLAMAEKRDHIDVLFLGDSVAAGGLNPLVFERNTDLQAFNLGQVGMAPSVFHPVVTTGILPSLPRQPEAYIVSFAPNTYRLTDRHKRPGISASPFARSLRQEWPGYGSMLALARLRHQIRHLNPDQHAGPKTDEKNGYQSRNDRKGTRNRRARTKLPPIPWLHTVDKQDKRVALSSGDFPEQVDAIEQLALHAKDRPVIVILPPTASKASLFRPLKAALGNTARDNIRVWDMMKRFTTADGDHLTDRTAALYTKEVAERFVREVRVNADGSLSFQEADGSPNRGKGRKRPDKPRPPRASAP